MAMLAVLLNLAFNALAKELKSTSAGRVQSPKISIISKLSKAEPLEKLRAKK